MESNRRIYTNEELTAFRINQHKQTVHDFAFNLLETVNGHPTQIGFTRLFSFMDADKSIDVKSEIIAEIKKSDKPADQQYAAIALYHLRDKISLENDHLKHYDLIAEAMKDENISLACMNSIYDHFATHMYTYLQRVPDNNKIQKLLFPTDRAPAWLSMVEKLQDIAEKKLVKDVSLLESPTDKLALLEKAEKMKIFTEANHNHAIGSLFARKSSISTIESMRQKISAEVANKASQK